MNPSRDRKKCSSCGKEKTLQRFYKDKRAKDGRMSMCKVCRGKKYDRGDSRRDRNLKYRYGISIEEYDELLQQQKGACAICDKKYEKGSKQFHIDHCHDNGHIRGILCHDCNTALGKLGDSIDAIKKVLKYLKGSEDE